MTWQEALKPQESTPQINQIKCYRDTWHNNDTKIHDEIVQAIQQTCWTVKKYNKIQLFISMFLNVKETYPNFFTQVIFILGCKLKRQSAQPVSVTPKLSKSWHCIQSHVHLQIKKGLRQYLLLFTPIHSCSKPSTKQKLSFMWVLVSASICNRRWVPAYIFTNKSLQLPRKNTKTQFRTQTASLRGSSKTLPRLQQHFASLIVTLAAF